MGLRVGLIYKAKGMPSGPKQLAALVDAGVPEDAIWNDNASRSTLESWFLSGRAVSQGDTLVVTTLNALGDTARKQGAVERKLEAMGVALEVAATDEGPSRPRGRPPEHDLTPEQQKIICDLWYDRNVPRATVVAQAGRIAGKEISQSTIKRICGMARKRPAK